MSAAVIAQCPSCRALGLVGAVVVDGSRSADGTPRAGLPCAACGAIAWLPLQTTASTVTTSSPPWPALPPPSLAALPSPEPSLPATPSPSTEAVPGAPSPAPPPAASPLSAAPSTAVATTFDDETLARIRARVAAAVPPHEGQQALAERFEALLTTKWGHEHEHKALLKMAAVSGELAFVGGCYRAVLDVVRDEPRARAAQGELLTMAMATMSAAKPEPGEQGPGRGKLVAAGLVMLAIGGGVFWFVRTLITSMASSGGLD